MVLQSVYLAGGGGAVLVGGSPPPAEPDTDPLEVARQGNGCIHRDIQVDLIINQKIKTWSFPP